MKVNHNMSAVITNKQLLRTENKVTEAMERLSSGLKINHSKDNPVPLDHLDLLRLDDKRAMNTHKAIRR